MPSTNSSANSSEDLKTILASNDGTKIKSLFAFDASDPINRIVLKFQLWARYFFPKYFSSDDAPFHAKIDLNNARLYRGEIMQFVDVAFKGAAKTSRTKLFVAFVIANDESHYRRYFRVLSSDGTNSTQIVTDIYNMLVSPAVASMYPELFVKTGAKREETMSSFTTRRVSSYTPIPCLCPNVGVAGGCAS